MDPMSKAEFCRLTDEEKFHQVFIRIAAGTRQYIDFFSPDGLFELHVTFSARESLDRHAAEADFKFPGKRLCEGRVR